MSNEMDSNLISPYKEPSPSTFERKLYGGCVNIEEAYRRSSVTSSSSSKEVTDRKHRSPIMKMNKLVLGLNATREMFQWIQLDSVMLTYRRKREVPKLNCWLEEVVLEGKEEEKAKFSLL